jgi:hypothetical protein
MIRTCPKCGDYYADALLTFCLADGTPLVNIDPHSERWNEGTRVIEEKENALRRQRRKLQWRRIVLSTMAIATLVVVVVAANSFIDVEPGREEKVAGLPSTPATAPAEPAGPITPTTPEETSPTLPTKTTATATPTPVYKISGRVTDGSKALGSVNLMLGGAKTATTTTDAKGNYTFKQLLAGGSYTITPASAGIDFSPTSRSFNNLTQDKSASFVGTAKSACTKADESRIEALIIKRCRATWRENILADQNKIIREYFPAGLIKISAHLSEKIEYQVTFSKACQAGVVTASYTWQVTAPTIRTVPLPKSKKFSFTKNGEDWRCL